MKKITAKDKDWPEILNTLKGGPKQLWVEGNIDHGWDAKFVAVVGSRRMTEYGRRVIEKLVPILVDQGIGVISGMMYGVDQTVHRACMACGGRTIAVLGWGLSYRGIADEDKILQKEIVEKNGVLISLWEDQQGTLWSFPVRDRIMAALASEIYVIEAAEKSGTMITVEWGKKMGKKIWAVPGPITSSVSGGTNRLIAEGVAQMWLPDKQRSTYDTKSSSKHTDLYIVLQNEQLTVDEIARKLKKPVEEVGAVLTFLMLSGEVCERGGKYYLQ